MKIIAYYLPQFHEIEENNKWWGEGFTEWTNVKTAKPLFKGHNQPVEPLNKNYYNLLDKETVRWQADLAEKFNIFGFCYYHYWFEGRMVLEKPAENLLKWKDINKRFCFCWANHSWKKTWNGTMEMLIKQDYGQKEEWEQHINYLLKFFKDERYIKINNKPVLMIYSSKDVKDLDARMEFYDEKCRENGLDGIFFLESFNHKNQKPVSNKSSGIVIREPGVAISCNNTLKKIVHKVKRDPKYKFTKKPMLYDYNSIYKQSLEFSRNLEVEDKRVFLGNFCGWDSTPRHGKRGYVINNNNKDAFHSYLDKQKEDIINGKEEFVFMNAWNEWAEGMYLEPDEKKKYELLEVIKEVTSKK